MHNRLSILTSILSKANTKNVKKYTVKFNDTIENNNLEDNTRTQDVHIHAESRENQVITYHHLTKHQL